MFPSGNLIRKEKQCYNNLNRTISGDNNNSNNRIRGDGRNNINDTMRGGGRIIMNMNFYMDIDLRMLLKME